MARKHCGTREEDVNRQIDRQIENARRPKTKTDGKMQSTSTTEIHNNITRTSRYKQQEKRLLNFDKTNEKEAMDLQRQLISISQININLNSIENRSAFVCIIRVSFQRWCIFPDFNKILHFNISTSTNQSWLAAFFFHFSYLLI